MTRDREFEELKKHNEDHAEFDELMTSWNTPDLDAMNLMEENDEEFAAEFAYADPSVHSGGEAGRQYHQRVEESDYGDMEINEGNHALGWGSLIFAIASWFVWPIIMGVVSIVLGVMAYRSESRTLGGWAIGLGAATLVFQLLILPFYRALFV